MIGFVVIFAMDDRTGDPISVVGVLAVLGAALAISEAGVIVKSFPKVHPAVENGLAMLMGTVVLLVLSVLFGELRVLPAKTQTAAALVYLIVAGSIIVFALFLFILSRWTASAASYQFVLTPFITFPLAAWLLGERLTLPMLLGAVGVVFGVYIGALHSEREEETGLPAQCGPDVVIHQDLVETVETG